LIGVVADRKWHLGIGGTTTPKTMSGEQLGHPRAIRQIGLHEREARVGAKEFETRFFEQALRLPRPTTSRPSLNSRRAT
jgi:hypothetical protein